MERIKAVVARQKVLPVVVVELLLLLKNQASHNHTPQAKANRRKERSDDFDDIVRITIHWNYWGFMRKWTLHKINETIILKLLH